MPAERSAVIRRASSGNLKKAVKGDSAQVKSMRANKAIANGETPDPEDVTPAKSGACCSGRPS